MLFVEVLKYLFYIKIKKHLGNNLGVFYSVNFKLYIKGIRFFTILINIHRSIVIFTICLPLFLQIPKSLLPVSLCHHLARLFH